MVKSVILLLCITVGIGFAQQMSVDSLDGMLESAKIFYNNGEYEKAINELEKALKFLKQLKYSDQVEAYKYLSFSYVAFGNNQKAKETFKKALVLNPDLVLDPKTVSPKIIKVFEEAKAEVITKPPEKPTRPVVKPEKPVVVKKEKSRLGATARSCCLPGWGQIYKGQGGKGVRLMIAAGLTSGLSILSFTMKELTHNNYLEADPHDPQEIKDAYGLYKFWHNATIFSGASFLGVYIYNLYDAITSKTPGSHTMNEPERDLCLSPTSEGIKLVYRIRF
ncbi:MAG TPA: hypothetical protein EYP58_03260 [bacterium (Candidatus Stahlbacteria)]|nr:hypothetical protein [Candidatus Stahlbacteria bacterium]